MVGALYPERIGYGRNGVGNEYERDFDEDRRTEQARETRSKIRGRQLQISSFDAIQHVCYFQSGISGASSRAVSAVRSMNIPQQLKDMKLPDLPQAIKELKF